ncbi:MAG TPA: DUF3617 family protein [Allosphingosinicella sp.]|jgi:hypothetical protein|nr:DUF3617 family protein [Allosphingosinicella sp.]
MRILTIVPICLVVAACSGGDEANNQAAAPETLAAGTWQTSFEVTQFRSADTGTPALKAKVGDKEQGSTCIAASRSVEATPELFAGTGYSCTYQTSYIKQGMINGNIQCTRPELKGTINMSVSGTYTADSFEAEVDSNSYLPGPGNFRMTRKVKGKLTPGACQPAATDAEGNASAGAAGNASVGAKESKGG